MGTHASSCSSRAKVSCTWDRESLMVFTRGSSSVTALATTMALAQQSSSSLVIRTTVCLDLSNSP